jgi:hypothetical protein
MIGTRSFWLKSLSVVGASGLLLFAFQNCGKAGFDQALETVPLGTVDAASSSAPFAFDATFDQITYNSCFGQGLTTSQGFFTLKAGAYSTGGVSVRSEFVDYAKTSLKPIYPATVVTVEQMKQFVVGTTENAEAQLQMALRYRGAPQKMVSPSGGNAPVLGTDFSNLLMDLTDDRMMEPIFRNAGTSISYFPLGLDATQRTLESKINYNTSETVAMAFRATMESDALLSLTYTAFRDAPGRARMPANSGANESLAYGRGYALRFAQEIAPLTTLLAGGYAIPNAKNPNNFLVQVSEVNLENPAIAPAANWTCDASQRFTIVRAVDAVNPSSPGYCPADSFESMRDVNYRKQLEIVRRHLPPDQWDVSISRHCAVPKSGSCYLNSSGAEEPVEYDQRNECYQNVQGFQNAAITNRCAQFISICIRQ